MHARKKLYRFVIVALLSITTLSAQNSNLLNFHARVSSTDNGEFIEGQYSVVFTLYDSGTAGNVLWTETQSVLIQNGILNVLLGGVEPLGNVFDKAVWLGIKIGDDDEMSPRQPIVGVPYSFNSLIAEDVTNKDIHPKSISIGETRIIDENGIWIGDPSGLIGPSGLAGPAGPKGDKGDKGNSGDKGDKGNSGDKGDKGNSGDKGDKGNSGDKGDKGNSGDKGDKGNSGEKGDKGDKGNRGDQGPEGPKGQKGDKGDKNYTWVKYADDAEGNGMKNNSMNKSYMGLAYNKSTPAESNDPSDYEWIAIASSPGTLVTEPTEPTGMIIMFSGDKIPAGWKEVEVSDSNGKYLLDGSKKIIFIQKVR